MKVLELSKKEGVTIMTRDEIKQAAEKILVAKVKSYNRKFMNPYCGNEQREVAEARLSGAEDVIYALGYDIVYTFRGELIDSFEIGEASK